MQGAIITALQNRFKEFRRERKSPKLESSDTIPNVPSIKKPEARQSPNSTWMKPPPVPVGEDNCSFERFCSQLRDEARRMAPRKEITSKLMEATYALRRQDILISPTPIPELLKKYPLLADEDEVCLTSSCFLQHILILFLSIYLAYNTHISTDCNKCSF